MRARSISAVLVAVAALAARPAAGAVVDPWRTTLAALAREADAVVHARLGEASRPERRIEVESVLWVREGAPAPATALAPASLERAAGARALAFLARAEDGRYRLLGSERGWVEGDQDAAEAFVRSYLAAEGPERMGLLVAALGSPSGRVREDALRDIAAALASGGVVEPSAEAAVVAAARAGLATTDPEPALFALARLPRAAGEPVLLEAARGGVAPRLVGAALRGRREAIDALLLDLRAEKLDAGRAGSVLRALGHAGDRRATAALVARLDRPSLRGAALEALSALRDPAAVPALKEVLREGMSLDLAWAAVALAYTGGDEAMGALEFALHNHEDAEARRFVAKFLASPADVRAALAEESR